MRAPILITLFLITLSCSERPEEIRSENISAVAQAEKPFIINSLGDTIPTGIPIAIEGRQIPTDSVSQPEPRAFAAKPQESRFPSSVYEALSPRLVAIPNNLVAITPGQDGIPLPKTQILKGQKISVKQPPPIRLPPLSIKEAATRDIRYLGAEHGFNTDNIEAILEDHGGHLWFGSRGAGVIRYDGKQVVRYTENEGLPRNVVFALLEDQKGNIWIGALDGLTRYDGEHFWHYYFGKDFMGAITGILEDQHGHLWLANNQRRLIRFDPVHEEAQYFTKTEGLLNGGVAAMIEDRSGSIWIAGGNAVARYDPSAGSNGSFTHFSEAEGFTLRSVRSVIEDDQGRIWFGGRGGVCRYDPQSTADSNNHFAYFMKEEGFEFFTLIDCLLADTKGNIWFGGPGGATKYDGKQFIHYGQQEGIAGIRVDAMLEDSEGNLWFSTRPFGVSRFSPGSYEHFFAGEGIQSILQDSRGRLWMGLGRYGDYSDGVFRYEPHQSIVQEGTNGNLFHYGPESPMREKFIYEDSKGHLWFEGSNGAIRYDQNRDILVNYTVKEGLAHNFLWSMLEDSHGNFWFAGVGGVTRFDPGRGLKGFTHFTEQEGLSAGIVFSLKEDSKGSIWIGTWGGGLSRFDPDQNGVTGKIMHFTTIEGLSHNVVNLIHEDNQGHLWIGTGGGGINYFDGKKFTPFTESHGLPSNSIWSIVEDNEANIWVTTSKGMGLFVPVEPESSSGLEQAIPGYRFFAFGMEDGLGSKHLNFSFLSGCLDNDNRMWWGGQEGLTMLDLNKFELPTEPPKKVQLTTIDIAQQHVDYRALKDFSNSSNLLFAENLKGSFDSVVAFYNYPVGLQLPYHLNHLTFHFTAIDWTAPHKIRYSYRMEGLDQKWSAPSLAPFAEYRNLPYGHFTLMVKATGGAQVWSEPYTYRFLIAPPWWHTWWARVLYIFATLALIYGIVRWRTATLKKQQKLLEQTVAERTAEVVAEKERSDALLLNILPAGVAEELKIDGVSPARDFDQVTVLFTDFQQFTTISEKLTAHELVSEINVCFKAFDNIITKYQIEKIKTIGDSYMAAGGLHRPRKTEPKDVVHAALEMQQFMRQRKKERGAIGAPGFEMRCGIHTGPVVAGIVGVKKFQYDIWGDTVNLASRMESTGEAGKVNISYATYALLKDDPSFGFSSRGKLKVKHKGEIEMYFVDSP